MKAPDPSAVVKPPNPPGHPPEETSDVGHCPTPIWVPGRKPVPLTVTDWPWTRSTFGVAVIAGGGGGGTLTSKLTGVATTATCGELNDDVTIEHAPGALAQSKSPLPSRSTRRTGNGIENVPAGETWLELPDWMQSSYELASDLHSTDCT